MEEQTKKTNRNTYKQPGRQTDRQVDRETDRKTVRGQMERLSDGRTDKLIKEQIDRWKDSQTE